MIPYIHKGELFRLDPRRQKTVCACLEKCNYFYTFSFREQDFMLCEGDTKQFGFEILQEIGVLTKKLAFPQSKYGWTTEQERFIKNYFATESCYTEAGRVKYGLYNMLGEMLGKSREQVKNKIQHMQKEGKL